MAREGPGTPAKALNKHGAIFAEALAQMIAAGDHSYLEEELVTRYKEKDEPLKTLLERRSYRERKEECLESGLDDETARRFLPAVDELVDSWIAFEVRDLKANGGGWWCREFETELKLAHPVLEIGECA